MALTGYIKVPDTATVGGAPIDAFQGDAFRQNDAKFEEYLRSIIYSPMLRNAGSGVVTDPHLPVPAAPFDAHKKIWTAKELTINTDWPVVAGWPLIIFATDKIKLNAKIDGVGKGPAATVGHLGGSGGGGTSAGSATVMPVAGQVLLTGGPSGANGLDLVSDDWFQFMLPLVYTLKGGGAGGDGAAAADKGGNGGGLVMLAAPEIEFTATGIIDVSGGNGLAGAGGGGGGAVIFICKKITLPAGQIFSPAGTFVANTFVKVDGGEANAAALVGAPGKGGKGRAFKIQVP